MIMPWQCEFFCLKTGYPWLFVKPLVHQAIITCHRHNARPLSAVQRPSASPLRQEPAEVAKAAAAVSVSEFEGILR